MLLRQERSYEPYLWFAWRPVYARSGKGRPGGWVWGEQVVAEYIEGTWGGGGGWHYTRVPRPTDAFGYSMSPEPSEYERRQRWEAPSYMPPVDGFDARGVGRILSEGVRRAVDERIARDAAEGHHRV